MIGEQVGNFKIVSLLGKGGMGEVYLGEHIGLGTRVAVKMLLPHVSENEELVQRFFNEAKAVGQIQHAGTGKIFDSGHHAGRAYLVMEFLPGETLGARLRRLRKLPLGYVGELGQQIAGVLEAVHKAGITHRDLKPDNIFIVPDDELASGERIKIVDFGIAKLSGAGGGITATTSGSMGTPAYMSPEQWKNAKNVDWRADAYSLGCLTFEMIAGRPPFIAESIGEACAKHLTEDAPRLASVFAVPPALDTLIASLLEKTPEKRPASMREIANAFGAIAAAAPPDLGATKMSGQLSSLALGATQTTGVPANQATQATGVAIAPLISPPPVLSTTLGTASAQLVPAPAKRGVPMWIVAGLGVALAGAITLVVVMAMRAGEQGQKRDTDLVSSTRSEIDATLITPPDAPPIAVQDALPVVVVTDAPVVTTGSGGDRANARGVASIGSVPRGATLELDGKVIGTTPRRIELAVGPHTIIARLDGHKPEQKSFTVRPDVPFTHTFRLGDGGRVGGETGVLREPLPEKLVTAMIVSAVSKQVGPQIRNCGNSYAGSGTVHLAISLGSSGQINELKVTMTPNPTLGQCVKDLVRSVKYPPSRRGGSAILIYPFTSLRAN